ncbi:MAG: hypothetical protein PHF63_05330 [Herbinix sp.]|nr:hypothetical protein [Herbinix sp.]
MNLPFGLPHRKQTTIRRHDETAQTNTNYDHKLAEYRDALESYKKCILEYLGKLDNYDKRSLDNQLTFVQTAIDITYLKEQGDKSFELLEDMKVGVLQKLLTNLESMATTVLDTNNKVDELDKNVVNRLSELLLELQNQSFNQSKQLQGEMLTEIGVLKTKIKKNHILIWLLFIFNLIGLSGLAFIILYVMGIIAF